MNKRQLKAKLLFANDINQIKEVINCIIDEFLEDEQLYDPYEGMSMGDLDDDWGDR